MFRIPTKKKKKVKNKKVVDKKEEVKEYLGFKLVFLASTKFSITLSSNTIF